jgi:hypothetical protein
MNFLVRACALALSGGWVESLTSRLSWRGAAWGVGLFLLTFSVSLAETVWILVKLPASYFSASHKVEFFADRSPAVRVVGLIGKNLLGVLHLVLGVLMSLPGVPGQGILTILIGIILLDIPGTRKLEIKIVSRPKVLGTINRIRARFHKPPLELD